MSLALTFASLSGVTQWPQETLCSSDKMRHRVQKLVLKGVLTKI